MPSYVNKADKCTRVHALDTLDTEHFLSLSHTHTHTHTHTHIHAHTHTHTQPHSRQTHTRTQYSHTHKYTQASGHCSKEEANLLLFGRPDPGRGSLARAPEGNASSAVSMILQAPAPTQAAPSKPGSYLFIRYHFGSY